MTLRSIASGEKCEIFQRGMGRTSLCADCNGRTARWYGRGFREWTTRAHELLDREVDVLFTSIPCFPLHVVKQAATMFAALSEPFLLRNGWYRSVCRSVLTPHLVGTPNDFRVYVYLTATPTPRITSYSGSINTMGVRTFIAYGEVALPPMGYVFMPDEPNTGKVCARLGLTEITRFFGYGYHRQDAPHLRLRRLTPVGAGPLEYKEVNQPSE